MLNLRSKYFENLWPSIIKRIMEKGEIVQDERGQNTREILNLIWSVSNPESSCLPIGMNPTAKRICFEDQNQMINPDKGEFVYRYGNRLREHFGMDQIGVAIDRLNKCRESRRAISLTWNPTIDTNIEEVPCMILVDFKIRKDILHTTALWRSHDAFGAIPANFWALRQLHYLVAKNTQSKMGPITVHSISAHIYEHDWDEAERII